MRRIAIASFMLVIISSLFSCKTREEYILVRYNGETQGTYYAITCYVNDSVSLKPSIDSLLKRYDSSASIYKPNSIISRINRNDPGIMADEIFKTLFTKAIEVSEKTDGAFDITVGPLVNAWGFGFEDRLKVDQHIVDSLLPLIGYRNVRLENNRIVKADPRIRIDFNAIAQGYAVDLVAGFLDSQGIESYLVDIGGEVVAKGKKTGGVKWNVGIEKPSKTMDDSREIKDVVTLTDMALSTSGNYRKYFEENGERYSHTIDPSTGYPVKHSLLSVSVLASDCMTADAFATAFMVMGLEKSREFLAKNKELDAYFIYSSKDGSMQTYYSDGFIPLLKK